jgi:hypothetical protein
MDIDIPMKDLLSSLNCNISPVFEIGREMCGGGAHRFSD